MRKHIIFFALCALSLTACKKEAGVLVKQDAPMVEVMETTIDAQNSAFNYTGSLQEANTTTASFAVSGTINKIYVKEGQRVNRGQLIATLDPRSLQQAVNLAQATRDRAQDAYDRVKLMYDSAAVAEIKLVEVRTALAQADATLEVARKNLQDTRLTAPESGIIGKKPAQAGENVMPGQPVVTILNVNALDACFAVPEGEMQNIAEGDNVTVRIPVLDDAQYNAVITEKGMQASTGTHAYQIKARIENPGADLLPGMLCDVTVSHQNVEISGIEVPVTAIHAETDGRNALWVVRDSMAQLVPITTGTLTPTGILITSGLQEGDKVIISGMNKVSQGQKVRVK